jgi:hypothetical protein
MPTSTTDTTSALTDAIVSGVKQSQELAFSGINAWVDFTGKAFSLPKADGLPFADSIPNPREFVEASFGFAEELLATQKEFAIKFVEAVAPKSA